LRGLSEICKGGFAKCPSHQLIQDGESSRDSKDIQFVNPHFSNLDSFKPFIRIVAKLGDKIIGFSLLIIM
jgi:hypothetical protein